MGAFVKLLKFNAVGTPVFPEKMFMLVTISNGYTARGVSKSA
jgi:hypothetical protein